jgi:hypothetical protein
MCLASCNTGDPVHARRARRHWHLRRFAHGPVGVWRLQRSRAGGQATMKKIKTTRRLTIHRETLRELQLSEVTGAGTILVQTKPQASCFIPCLPTNGCPPTRDCPLITFNC